MPHPKVKISDDSGNTVDVTSNALDVNIAGGASIDIGDVDMFLDGGTAIVGNTGAVTAGTLRVTLATDDPHWGEVGAASDVDGVAHGQLRYIGNSLSGLATQATLSNMQTSLNHTLTYTGGQYSEGDYHTNGIVRNDTLASLVTDDNDYTVLQVNADGALYVTGGGGGTEYTEDVATANPIVGTATLIERDDALSSVTPAEGDWIGLRGTAEGALWTQDFNSDTITTHLSEIEGAVETIEGAVSGSEMQVDVVSSASHAVTNAGTFATQVDGDALTALEKIDDIQDVIGTQGATGPSKCVSIGGTYGALTQEISVNGSGGVHIAAIASALPAGTNAIGKLSANSGVDIGDVDITSIAAGDNNIGNVDIASALPAGSNTIGVVDLGSTDNAVLDAIAASLALLDNSIASGNELQVDVVAALPAGTNAIGIVGHDVTGMVSDLDADVGTTAEKIHTASDVAIKRIDIQAHPENTGYIFVGDSGVAGNGSGGGIRLAAGDFYSLDIDNTGDVYVAASVADENVSYIYYT